VALSAADPDLPAQTLSYSVASGPAWATVAGQTLTFAPGNNTSGDYIATARVEDGAGGSDEYAVPVTVIDTNFPPVMGPIAPQVTSESMVHEMQLSNLSVTDPDGDPVTFRVADGPSWAVVDPPYLRFSPPFDAVSRDQGMKAFSAVIRATDGSLIADETVTVNVAHVERPPELGPVAPVAAPEGGSVVVPLVATDPDAEHDIYFSMASGPSWATVDGLGPASAPVYGTLTLTPGPNDAGDYSITVRADDGLFWDEVIVDVTVQAANSPADLAAVAPQTLSEGAVLDVPLAASDPDFGQTLTLSLVSGPAWATVTGSGPSPASGMLTLAPGTGDAGSYTVTVRVVDGAGAYDDEAVAITVTPP
jgi:hypothetical protein